MRKRIMPYNRRIEWQCPYFQADYESSVICAGKVFLPSRKSADSYMKCYCADRWQECSLAAAWEDQKEQEAG